MGETPSPAPEPAPAPALWDWGYLDRCFARHRVCISFSLWLCASSCWIAAHTLLLYLRCAKKCRQDQSALCAACCLLASLCDTVGAILARQLTIQVFTGAYLAAVDLMNFVFILFPVCGSKFKSNSGHGSQERKGRRRLRASVFALTLPLSLGPCWALWAAVPKASGLVQGPQRRLLGSRLQDNTEMFGYLLGGIAACGSWASRIPPLSRICRGKTFPCIHLWTRLLSALAGLLYASAIVAHDRRPEYLLRATPWFLTSLSRAALDLAIIFLSWVMKSKMRRALGFASEARESPDTQALLTCAEKEEDNEEARNRGLENRWSHQCLHVEGTENSDWVPLTTLPHCKPLRTMTAISHYMELTIEPVQQAGCSAARLPGDGQTSTGDVPLQEPPSYPPIRVIRARVSSSSSSEVPSINSDLETSPQGVVHSTETVDPLLHSLTHSQGSPLLAQPSRERAEQMRRKGDCTRPWTAAQVLGGPKLEADNLARADTAYLAFACYFLGVLMMISNMTYDSESSVIETQKEKRSYYLVTDPISQLTYGETKARRRESNATLKINLEGNKDNVKMLRSQMQRCPMRPVDLTSDE